MRELSFPFKGALDGGGTERWPPLASPRFSQVATFARVKHVRELEGVDAAFIGVPFDDLSTFRPGSRFGPRAVREASTFLRSYNPALDVDPFQELTIVDYGDVDVVPGYAEPTFKAIEEELAKVVGSGAVPVSCGGDHSISLPILRALRKKYSPISLVHFDAHSDCGKVYFGKKYGHGTVFRRAVEEGLVQPESSIQIGIRGSLYSREERDYAPNLGFAVVTAEELRREGVASVASKVRRRVGRLVYVSFDIDVCDPAFAPGTGTPEVGGLTSWEALGLVRGLAGASLIGFDLVEVSPPYDPSGVTALLAANVIFEFLSALAKSKR